MSGFVACTIAAGNYLPYVHVLARSFASHNPDTPFRVLLVASEAECVAAEGAGLDIVRMRDLDIPVRGRMLRRYDRKQMSAALKPALLRHLLESGHDTVVFLDADILVTASLDPLFEDVARHALSLTPHISPGTNMAGRAKFEKILLRAGMYNAGFVGVSNREETRAFLAWWEGRLRTHCLNATRKGFHYDQRWLDHALGFVDDLHIVRDPGCNAAYWNLTDREIRFDGTDFRLDGFLLRFFHFSGFDPSRSWLLTRHVPGWRVDSLGPEMALFRRYAALLREAGRGKPGHAPWLRGRLLAGWRWFADWLSWKFTRPNG